MQIEPVMAENYAEKEQGCMDKMKRLLKSMRSDYDLYLMLVPMVVIFCLFSYKPMTGLLIAFKDYSPFKGIWDSEWVGFEYFIEFFRGAFAPRVIRNTLVISLSMLIFGFPAPILLALLLNEVRGDRFRKLVQTVSYIPHFISIVVVCSMVTSFLSPTSGVVNTILERLVFSSIYFLANPGMFVPIYVILNVWKTMGYNSIVYIAALTSIPSDLYEAAEVDGAGRLQKMLHITIPGLLPTIMVMLLVQLGNILNVGYETVILLYNPSIYETADIINTYVYRTGIMEGRYDYATAIGLLNSVVSLILVVGANKLSKKLTETSLW